jgi:hypothetical protein
MSNWLRSIASLSLLTLASGCFVAPVIPPTGLLFTLVEAPITTTYKDTTIGPLKGESTSHQALWLVAFGNAGVAEAARNGRIDRVNHVEYRYMNLLQLYQGFTIIAYGESTQ